MILGRATVVNVPMPTTRWTTTLSSKVTQSTLGSYVVHAGHVPPLIIEGNEIRVVHRVDGYNTLHYFCLTESVYQVVLRKSVPAQVRRLMLYIGNDKE